MIATGTVGRDRNASALGGNRAVSTLTKEQLSPPVFTYETDKDVKAYTMEQIEQCQQ
jgi:hypothetical protein